MAAFVDRTVVCACCGEVFERASRGRPPKYCSDECKRVGALLKYRRGSWRERECASPSCTSRFCSTLKYCSDSCFVDGARKKSRRVRSPRKRANQRYVRDFGVTLAWVEERLKEQRGRCAICDEEISFNLFREEGKKVRSTACLDHCHETGRIRGVLCSLCNSGLGKFKDNEGVMFRAVRYLRNPPAPSLDRTAEDEEATPPPLTNRQRPR